MTPHKRKYQILVFALLILMVSSACTFPLFQAVLPPATVDPQPSVSPVSSIDASATPFMEPATPEPLEPTAAPTTQENLPAPPVSPASYNLYARLDNGQHTVEVSEIVTYTNPSSENLADFVFDVEPNRYPGAFLLKSIAWQDGSPVDGYTLNGNRLMVPLRQSLQPGGRLSLSITYELQLPEIPPPSDTARPVPFGYTNRQTNIVDWYPFLPPYRSPQGWLVHDPGFFGEHQVYDTADFQVTLERIDSGSPLVVAASAPAEQEGNIYRYQFENARSFALSASVDYQVISTTVGMVSITSYYLPFTPEAGQAALNDTAAALQLYSQLYGPYPHKTLSVVEADFLDGMEYDGLYFLSRGFYNLYDGSPKGYLTAIAVHETAHQWWYGLAGNDQALEPWLDEALCTYSERLYYEHTYPNLVDWWWAFRVNFYQPQGWVNDPIYSYTGFRPYVNAVYLRGATFLEELRTRIGDPVFFAFLKDYLSQETHHISTAQDFFTILKAHTTVDYQDLVDAYFHKP